MDAKTRERMLDAVAALASSFGRQADEPLFAGFEMGLDGLTGSEIESAASRALQTSKFMPAPSELRELAGELSPKARAVIAWEHLSRAASSGYYTTVDFDDPVINAAVRNIGGWELVTTFEDANEFESFVRHRFEAAYVALYQHGISSEQAAPLLGYHDRQNALGGYAMQPPLRIETSLPASKVRIGGSNPKRLEGEPKRIGEVLAPAPYSERDEYQET